MSIKVIDTLSPLGSFPVAQAKDIDVNGTALNTVLAGKANATDVNNKVDKVNGKGLSTNDYDNTEKAKVTAFGSMFTLVN